MNISSTAKHTLKGAGALAMCLALIILITGCSSADKKAEESLFAMDTYMTFTAYGKNADDALKDAKEIITSCENLWSVTKADSEISRLNAAGELPLSKDTRDILAAALYAREYTGGCFDISVYPLVEAWGFTNGNYRVPDETEISELLKRVGEGKLSIEGDKAILARGSRLDLGGIAKGFVGDMVIKRFKDSGISSALISLGGNIHALGSKPDGSKWKIAIQSPYDQSYLGVLSVSDKCVITSGIYERNFTAPDGTLYGHIISPFDGRPVSNDLCSVTVVCDEGRLGDALSTALFVMGGSKAVEFWKVHEGFELILLCTDGTLYVTQGVYGSFEPRNNTAVTNVCEIKR